MSSSVADRVIHRLSRPIKCDSCGGPRVNLQKRGFMGLRVFREWDLIWHCMDCDALVGCHEGTDIPMGLMADGATRHARFEAHKYFDRLWRGRNSPMSRAEAYAWMAQALNIPPERAHVGMLDAAQCEALSLASIKLKTEKQHDRHWSMQRRKKRR